MRTRSLLLLLIDFFNDLPFPSSVLFALFFTASCGPLEMRAMCSLFLEPQISVHKETLGPSRFTFSQGRTSFDIIYRWTSVLAWLFPSEKVKELESFGLTSISSDVYLLI